MEIPFSKLIPVVDGGHPSFRACILGKFSIGFVTLNFHD